jgi:hypothetical protein
MIARTLLSLAAVAAGAGAARADDTFEAKAAGARRVHRVENLVWALTATCDKGDDTEQRECRVVRDRRVAQLAGATLLVDADQDAFDAQPYDAQKKSTQLTMAACIRCSGVTLEGKTWYVFGSTTPPHVEGDKVRGPRIGDTSKQFDNEAAAAAWAKQVASARVQMLVRVPAKPTGWSQGGKLGLALDILAYRVVAPCDGSIVMANIQSGPGDKDPKACAPISTAKASGDKVDELTLTVIKDSLEPVFTASDKCFQKFTIAGTAKLKFTVGADGSIEKYEQQGDFAGTPTGECIDRAVKTVTFPRSKKGRTSFTFPLDLR